MREQIVAQIIFHVARDSDQNHAHVVLENALSDGERDQQRGELKHLLQAKPGGEGIHAIADHQREHGVQHIFDDQGAHAQREAAPMTPHVRPGAGDQLPHGRCATGLRPKSSEWARWARVPAGWGRHLPACPRTGGAGTCAPLRLRRLRAAAGSGEPA